MVGCMFEQLSVACDAAGDSFHCFIRHKDGHESGRLLALPKLVGTPKDEAVA